MIHDDDQGRDQGPGEDTGNVRPPRVLIVTSLTLLSLLSICTKGSVDGNCLMIYFDILK